ncbi:hypothetical protein BU200_05880 [Streptococcus acidominimus]|uniref:Uncharacterized protein n=1 Tax=Streptococcus acidominimus TaxID=1326 RepID=A0A1Q8ED50_STRAI|nr:hypothetical protein BU200_05880 [Streptococcus acidominimus]
MIKNKYFLYLVLGNILTLSISFILSKIFTIPFKWWNSIAITTSSYVVYNYLENKKNKKE